MAGYTRQSLASIIPGAEVQAGPLNVEFNQLQSAFAGLTGHTHDGSVGNGPKIDLVLSVSGTLNIGNGGTGATTAEAARTSLFGVSTTVDNTLARYDGTAGALQTSLITVSDTGVVSGITGLTATGGGSLTGTWTDLGAVTTVDINGGTLDNVPVGATTRSSGAFTTLTANGAFSLTGDLVQITEGGTGANTAAGARTALGVEPLPPGMIVAYAMISPPVNWLECNGQAVNRVTYANLYTAIGTTYGAGDGSTTFNVPDLRAEFIRGFDNGRGVDSGRVFGSSQAGANHSHTHTGTTATEGAHTHTYSTTSATGGAHTHNVSGNTGYVSADHAHNYSGTFLSGGRTAAHTHSYSSALGGNNNGGGGFQGLPQTANTSTESADHAHYTSISGTTSGITVNHYHAVTGSTDSQGTHSHSVSGTTDAGTAHSHTFTTASQGSSDGRPRNIAMIYCIKT